MGDALGRKPALMTSMGLMTLSTCGIGLIPDYNTIGGPILLLLNLRILQSFSFSGELSGAFIFIVEHAPLAKRGFYGSFGIVGMCSGSLLGCFVAWVIHILLNPTAVVTWAWRIPFLLASLGGLLGWFMRRGVGETQLFHEMQRMPESFLDFYREYLKHIRKGIIIVGMTVFATVVSYLIYAFFFVYMTSVLDYTPRQTLTIRITSTIVLMLLMPFMGKISDHIGRRPLLTGALFGAMIWIWPYFWLLQQGNFGLAMLAALVMTLFAAAYFGVYMVAIVEVVPVQMRFRVVSLAYAVAISLFGGMTPFLATLLLKTWHSYIGLAIFFLVCALISLFAIYKTKETAYVPKSIAQKNKAGIAHIARDMLANGDSVEKVAAVTGLSKDNLQTMKS